MKIQKIKLPTPAYVWREKRCCRVVRSSGTTYFDNQRNRCGRMARYNMNGIALCTQHAGEAALKHLIDNQGAAR